MQLVNRKLHAKSGKVLSRSGKTKNIGLRVTPQKYAAVEVIADKLDLNIQQTVEAAIDVFLQKSDVAAVPVTHKPPRRGSVPEMLQLLLDGQRDIQDGVYKVLREITRGDTEKRLKPGDGKSHQLLEDGGFGDIPADLADLTGEDSESSGSDSPPEKDRPPEQTKAAPARTRRRKH
jgi:hypothetical protein